MAPWVSDALFILLALGLVVLNGFFVAAEFALVKVRPSQMDLLVRQKVSLARTAKWLADRMDASLSTCQLGITMASLGLGWIGEPAFARLLEPALRFFGVTAPAVIHGVAFAIAFTLITSLHLVIGEQAPKIYAIRRPEVMVRWVAIPLKFFYVVLYPFLALLNWITAVLLRRFGIASASEHDSPHTQEELRDLVFQAHAHGDLSRAENQLIHAVFEFDDMICRRVMVARSDVVALDVNRPVPELLEIIRQTKHTRYPLCVGSLDDVLGVLHIKDLVASEDPASADLRALARPARRVPETMPISRLLRQFQSSHQLMACVVDEHGTTIGVVTMENVLEPIIGSVEDEFDVEAPDVTPDGPGRFLVLGGAPIDTVARAVELDLGPLTTDVDTISGLVMTRLGRVPSVGDRVDFDWGTIEVTQIRGARAEQVRVVAIEPQPGDDAATSAGT